MPRSSFKAKNDAQQASREAQRIHDANGQGLLKVVFRVCRQAYADQPDTDERIKVHGGQLPLGGRFAAIVTQAQTATGVRLPKSLVVGFQPSSTILDVSLALNSHGFDPSYDSQMGGPTVPTRIAHEATVGIDQPRPEPWDMLGPDFAAIIARAEELFHAPLAVPDPSPETTFHELKMAMSPRLREDDPSLQPL